MKTLYMLVRDRLAEERTGEIIADDEITNKLADCQKVMASLFD